LEQARKWASTGANLDRFGSDASDLLDGLIRGLGMPRSLGAVKIWRDTFQRITVFGYPLGPSQPAADRGPDQVREILELATQNGHRIRAQSFWRVTRRSLTSACS
jgi:hypothetical protein